MAVKGLASVVTPPKPKPPKKPKPGSSGKPPGAPPTTNAHGVGTGNLPPILPSAPVAPPPAAAPPAAPPKPFNYAEAFYSDPRYAGGMAGIIQSQIGTGQKYGLTLNRDTDPKSPTYGMVKYRVPGSAAGTGNITAKIDPTTGAMTYSDPTGKTYSVADLELDVVPIARGQEGYLTGALGRSQAESENRQQTIGEAAAQAGARRSGMRAQASLGEVGALQSALRNLAQGYATEFGGTTQAYANLLNTIYPDLVKEAGAAGATETPAATPTPTPPPTTTPSAGTTTMPGVPTAPLQAPKSINIAGQTVSFPAGINLSGVDVQGIGRRIAGNVSQRGGVGKLKNGEKVGQFAAGGKGYWVVYRGGRFVIEAFG